MKYEPQWYTSPIDLPEATSGRVSVKHQIIPAGEKVHIVGMRQAFVRGVRPVAAVLPEPLRVHWLTEEGHGAWMSDLPEELNQIAEAIHIAQPRGRVCVGGLGLGILAATIANLPDVDEVIVVERSGDIVKLCANEYEYEVVECDIAQYLRICDPFDTFMLDTWQGTSENTWWGEVMPLRRIIRNRFGKKPLVHCWAEDIMWGQVGGSLMRGKEHWYYKGLGAMTNAEMMSFMRNVGFPAWEKRYGAIVDRNSRKEEEQVG